MRVHFILPAACLVLGGCATSTESADLSTWLGERCPDSATLQVTNTETRETIDLSYAQVRAQILAAAPALDMESVPGAGDSEGSERVGEAEERWSPAGVVCSILMAAIASSFNWPWGREGCNSPRAEHPNACKVMTAVVPAAIGIACAFL